MRLEAKKYYDIRQAAQQIANFTAGKRLEDYLSSPVMQAAVERDFEIIGGALAKLIRLDQSDATRNTDHRRIVAFRSIVTGDIRIILGSCYIAFCKTRLHILSSLSMPES